MNSNVDTNKEEGAAPSQTNAALKVVDAVISIGSKNSSLLNVGSEPSVVYFIGQSNDNTDIAMLAEAPLKTPPVCNVAHAGAGECDNDDGGWYTVCFLDLNDPSAHCTRTSLYKFQRSDLCNNGKLCWCSDW